MKSAAVLNLNRTQCLIILIISGSLFGCQDRKELDETRCVLVEAKPIDSPDGRYAAAIDTTTCEAGAEVVFRLKLTEKSVGGRHGWNSNITLERDTRDVLTPIVRWIDATDVEVTIPTRTLRGTLAQHIGDNLTVRRVYDASSPDAFPNYY